MTEISSFREKLQNLIAKFDKDETPYLSKSYPEALIEAAALVPLLSFPLVGPVLCLRKSFFASAITTGNDPGQAGVT